MSLVELDWDSNFFGFKIGKLDLQNLDMEAVDREVRRARNLGFSLLYLFSSSPGVLASDWQLVNGCHLMDTKVIYAKAGLIRRKAGLSVSADGSENVAQLYELAYESGRYSRFKLDAEFGEEGFQRLYRTWVQNSISRAIADDVLVYKHGSVVCGFCTVKYSKGTATIGLIAVLPHYQGKGIGRDLCESVETRAIEHGCDRIVVATQMANVGACGFYEKIGMKIIESAGIYHLWLKRE